MSDTRAAASDDDSTYDGPDSDIASGNITDADFAQAAPRPASADADEDAEEESASAPGGSEPA